MKGVCQNTRGRQNGQDGTGGRTLNIVFKKEVLTVSNMEKSLLGIHGEYTWFKFPNVSLMYLLDKCPQIVVGKYLIYASIDNGPMILRKEEIDKGWSVKKGIGYSPVISSIEEVLDEGPYEFYVYENSQKIGSKGLPALYGGPDLGDPTKILENMDPTWCKVSAKEQAGRTCELQGIFWMQIESVSPESYISDYNGLIVVTRDINLCKKLNSIFMEIAGE